jgi:hypothetical protein
MIAHVRPPAPRRKFLARLAVQGGYASALIGISLLIGMIGYHLIAHYTWIDAFLNASMLLGGMGPVGVLPDDASKVFAGVFALYSGLVFLLSAALLLTPVFHRVLHFFHWELSKQEEAK